MNISFFGIALVAFSLVAESEANAASQTAVVAAPISAVANGPSKATIKINATKVAPKAARVVVVNKSITAVATPLSTVTIRIH